MKNSIGLGLFSGNSVLIGLLLTFNIACNEGYKSIEDSSQSVQKTKEYLLEGKALSESYCKSCHLYAEPELLPKSIWENDVLPRMGAFYGIYEKEPRSVLLESGDARKELLEANIYPEKPTIDSIKWEKIKYYIIDSAPDSLYIPNRPSLELKDVFKVSSPKERISPPMATMAQYDKESGLIYHGDVKKDYSTINIFNNKLEMVQSLGMRSPAVKIKEIEGELWALLMGSFTSTDAPSGSVVKFSKKSSNQYDNLVTMIDGLQRPVDFAFGDLDSDGDTDILISQFGNWTGKVEWFENEGNNSYQRHLLMANTGPTKIIIEDVNKDGNEDILVMITQSDESVYLLTNQTGGKFTQQRLLQVPPTYGSLTFEYVDMDGDGIKDIVHTTGDNADYTAILKPYHGIRIYKGKGDMTFEEAYFYPVHGAYKAIPEDFDGDGDQDIAVISFFPDYVNGAKEALMMLENVSDTEFQFTGFTLPGYGLGRWDVMDSGDLDQDGDPDLIVGSFVVSDPYGKQSGVAQPKMMKGPMMMVLKNDWWSPKQ